MNGGSALEPRSGGTLNSPLLTSEYMDDNDDEEEEPFSDSDDNEGVATTQLTSRGRGRLFDDRKGKYSYLGQNGGGSRRRGAFTISVSTSTREKGFKLRVMAG